jgi:hypothetical protein
MRIKSPLRTFIIFSGAASIALSMAMSLPAEGCNCHCQPSTAVFHSPFYGYYRTCWRPWPGGQPPCPCYPPPVTEQPAPRAGTSERTIEQLPLPRPEEPETNEAK